MPTTDPSSSSTAFPSRRPPPSLLSHVSLGVRSYAASKCFYTAVLAPLGGTCVYDSPAKHCSGYGLGSASDAEALTLFQTDSKPAVPPGKDGVHFAFNAQSRSAVREFWEVAVENGATDAGAWGLRREYGERYYAAFVRDLDGYKLEAVYQGEDDERRDAGAEVAVKRTILGYMDAEYERKRERMVQQLGGMSLEELQRELVDRELEL